MEEKHKIQYQPIVQIPKRCWIYSQKNFFDKSNVNLIGTANMKVHRRRTGNKQHSLAVSYCLSFWTSTRTDLPSSDTLFNGATTQYWSQTPFCTDQTRTTRGSSRMSMEEIYPWRTQRLMCLYSESDELQYEFASCLCTACYFLMIGESITVYFKYEIYCYIIKYIVTFN